VSRLVALTGATGFVGAALLKSFAAHGWQVRALTRQSRPDAAQVEWVTGTLDDQHALHKLVENAAAVVHCAGLVRGRNAAEFTDVNVQGTANLLQASTQNGAAEKCLFISSLAARYPAYSWYAASKHQAEQHLCQQTRAFPWTIFRPTALYGPGDKEVKPLLQAMRDGILVTPGRLKQRLSLLHIDDFSHAVMSWLHCSGPVAGTFELDDGHAGGYSWEALADIAGQTWQRRVYRVAIPLTLLKTLAGINLGLARLLGYSPMLTPGKINEITHPDWTCDNTPLTQALGWKPQVKLSDAIQQACL